jgi:hypothetical protein
VVRIDIVPPWTTAPKYDACAVQPIRHRAVVDPKLGTDPAKRPTGGIQLRGSVHIHDQYPNFRRKPSTSARTRYFVVAQLQLFGSAWWSSQAHAKSYPNESRVLASVLRPRGG